MQKRCAKVMTRFGNLRGFLKVCFKVSEINRNEQFYGRNLQSFVIAVVGSIGALLGFLKVFITLKCLISR